MGWSSTGVDVPCLSRSASTAWTASATASDREAECTSQIPVYHMGFRHQGPCTVLSYDDNGCTMQTHRVLILREYSSSWVECNRADGWQQENNCFNNTSRVVLRNLGLWAFFFLPARSQLRKWTMSSCYEPTSL